MSPQQIHPELERVIQAVSHEYRRRDVARGWLRFGLFSVAAAVIFTGALLYLPDSGQRAYAVAVFLALEAIAGAWLTLPPLFRQVAPGDVALYVDEHAPDLENRFITAFEYGTAPPEGSSAWLIQQLTDESAAAASRLRIQQLVDVRAPVRRGVAAYALFLTAAAVVAYFHDLWLPATWGGDFSRTETSAAAAFTVEPGDARVRRGDQQLIQVKAERPGRSATIRWREAGQGWRSEAMQQGAAETAHFHQFANIQENIDYAVEYGGVRSPTYTITTWLPPETEAIDVTYNYPEYLGRPPREVPNAGDLTAVEGTVADLTVWANKPLTEAVIVRQSGARVSLEPVTDTRWTASVTMDEDDAYHLELVDADGAASEYHPEYEMNVLPDEPPQIEIEFPHMDIEVTKLDEVPFEFRVADDFGLAGYGLEYEIAGREPVRITLETFDTETTEAAGQHEIALEELSLEAGDLITWTLWANDRNPDRSRFEVASDPFFLEIRPFRKFYREAVSGAGAGGGMQGGDAASQKQIIIAIYNLRRAAPDLAEPEFKSKRDDIVGAQQDLKSQLVTALAAPGVPATKILAITKAMGDTISALEAADPAKPIPELTKATASAQEAYSRLLKLKPEETQVAQGQGMASAGNQSMPDLDQLETDRNRNFYEEEQRIQDDEENSETLNKLRELAQRQQLMNDELAKLISEQQKQEEWERRRRELERLEEEARKNLEQLDRIAGDMADAERQNRQNRAAQESMDRAREEMNRNLERLQDGRLQEARAAGSRALDTLNDAQQRLQQLSREAAAEQMRELQKRVQDMAQRNQEVLDKSRELREKHNSPVFDATDEHESERKAVAEETEALAEDFVTAMNEAGELADRSSISQEHMSRRLGDWLRRTSAEGIHEDLENSEQLIESEIWDMAINLEESVQRKLAKASAELDEVAERLVEDDLEGMQRALAELRQLTERGGETEQDRAAAANEETTSDGEGPSPAERPSEETAPGGQQPGESEDEGQEGQRGEGAESRQLAQSRAAREGPSPDERPSEETAPGGQQPGESEGEGQEGQGRGEGAKSRQLAQSRAARGRPSDGTDDGRSGAAARAAGDWRGAAGRWSDDALRRFAAEDYREWLESIRNAGELLPPDSPLVTDLAGIEGEIENIRRQWRERNLAPKFELFLNEVLDPLTETAARLERQIDHEQQEREFVLADDGEIPARYRPLVAEYFKTLSEAETAQ